MILPKRNVEISIIFAMIFFFASVTFAEATLDVTDQKKIEALNKVQLRIDTMSAAVKGCMDSGREHKICMCSNKDLFEKFAAKVAELFATYPDLKNHDLVGFKGPDGMYVTLSMEGIQKQAQMPLNCNE